MKTVPTSAIRTQLFRVADLFPLLSTVVLTVINIICIGLMQTPKKSRWQGQQVPVFCCASAEHAD